MQRRFLLGGALGFVLAPLLFVSGCPSSDTRTLISCPMGTKVWEKPSKREGSAPLGDEIRFVAFGDAGTGSASQYRVAHAIEKKCRESGCDFALLLGDNLYPSGPEGDKDIQFQTKFEAPYRALPFPFYVVLGNHDYGRHGLGDQVYKAEYSVRYTEHSPEHKWKMPATSFTFMKGKSAFLALDTTAQRDGRDASQRHRITAQLATSPAIWKIAFGHHPYLSNGPHGNATGGVQRFLEEVICGQVDLYLSGHDHSRQWLQPTCHGTELIVSGGGGAPLTPLPGHNPTHFASSLHGFLYVRIQGNRLEASFVNETGAVDYTRTLHKASATP